MTNHSTPEFPLQHIEPEPTWDRIALYSQLAQTAINDGWDPVETLIGLIGQSEYDRVSPFLKYRYPGDRDNGHNDRN